MDNHKLLPYIYIASILASLLFERKLRPQWNTSATIILVVICIFLSIKQIHDFSSSSIRIVISTFILLLFFPKHVLNRTTLSVLILLSAIFSLFYLTYQHHILGIVRNWSVNPIIHSTFTASFLAISFYFSLSSKGKVAKVNFVSNIILAYCINLSATRSSLLCFLFSGIFLIYYLFKVESISLKKSVPYYSLLILIIAANSMFIDRIMNTVSIVESHENTISTSDKSDHSLDNTSEAMQFEYSANYRLNAWAASIDVIRNTFPIGAGENVKPLLGEKLISPSSILSTVPFHHFHNQFINSLAFYGILGLAFVLILLLYPVFCFIKYKNEASLIFTIVSIVYVIACLTDVALDSKPTLCFYLTMFIVYQYYSPINDHVGDRHTTNNKQNRLDHASHI
nr:O-antigen ligase family protein [Vibrio sp. 99-8-1]